MRENGPLFGYFDLFTKAELARAKWFSKEKNYQPSVAEFSDLLEKFLLHVVHGEKDQVEEMLKKNLGLLFKKGRVIDYSGRTIEGTAYQMALGAEDVSYVSYHHSEGMAEMIRSYFKVACNNDEKAASDEIQKQQEEQFPGGYDNYENSCEVKTQKAKDSEALKAVMQLIAIADVRFKNGKYNEEKDGILVDDKCKQALDTFREYLRPKAIIRKGKHFNMELLIEALNMFDRLGSVDNWFAGFKTR